LGCRLNRGRFDQILAEFQLGQFRRIFDGVVWVEFWSRLTRPNLTEFDRVSLGRISTESAPTELG